MSGHPWKSMLSNDNSTKHQRLSMKNQLNKELKSMQINVSTTNRRFSITCQLNVNGNQWTSMILYERSDTSRRFTMKNRKQSLKTHGNAWVSMRNHWTINDLQDQYINNQWSVYSSEVFNVKSEMFKPRRKQSLENDERHDDICVHRSWFPRKIRYC